MQSCQSLFIGYDQLRNILNLRNFGCIFELFQLYKVCKCWKGIVESIFIPHLNIFVKDLFKRNQIYHQNSFIQYETMDDLIQKNLSEKTKFKKAMIISELGYEKEVLKKIRDRCLFIIRESDEISSLYVADFSSSFNYFLIETRKCSNRLELHNNITQNWIIDRLSFFTIDSWSKKITVYQIEEDSNLKITNVNLLRTFFAPSYVKHDTLYNRHQPYFFCDHGGTTLNYYYHLAQLLNPNFFFQLELALKGDFLVRIPSEKTWKLLHPSKEYKVVKFCFETLQWKIMPHLSLKLEKNKRDAINLDFEPTDIHFRESDQVQNCNKKIKL